MHKTPPDDVLSLLQPDDDWMYTGSRFICPTLNSTSDYDYVIFTASAPLDLANLRFTYEGLGQAQYPREGFASWRRGEVNIILTSSRQFFDRFVLATWVAKKLRLASKEDRVTLFQAILYEKVTV